MTSINIHEQIAFLRRQKGLTQEQLAKALGVTNQTVSKWESAQCCPDIQLLPEIAAFFGVSIDNLLGYRPVETVDALCLNIRRHVTQLPEGQAFESCYKIAALLHELALTDGYKRPLPWKHGKEYSDEKPDQWGLSVNNLPEGCTGRHAGALFFSLPGVAGCKNSLHFQQMSAALSVFAQPDVLSVLFALYCLTAQKEDVYVSAELLARQASLPPERVSSALCMLPVDIRNEADESLYRLDERYLHLPALLSFFVA